MRITLLLLALCALAAVAVKAPPTWPKQYYVEGVFTLPYVNLEEPVAMHYDAVNNRQRMSYYNGQDIYTWRWDTQLLYEVVPRINKMTCFVQQVGSGPMVTVLPDLSKWTYAGKSKQRNVMCDTWTQTVTNFNKTAHYYFYESEGVPVKLYLEGYDFVFGSHPDLYEFTYDLYIPNYVDEMVFDEPKLCAGKKPINNVGRSHRAKQMLGKLSLLTPTQATDEFGEFAARYQKFHFNEETDKRRAIYFANKKLIESHNALGKAKHRLAMNHFGDFDHNEWKAVMTPKSKPIQTKLSNAQKHVSSGAAVPDAIDWREIGGVTPIKDQGACGSCWTFGTAGSIEGGWFVKSGHLISLSEQQILDCSWRTWVDDANTGCDGGEAAPAMQWIVENGGLATEFDYKYQMQDGYCRPSVKSSEIRLTGYVNVTQGSEEALKEAVAQYGPVAIAIDASNPDFTYYTEGVYYNPNCKTAPAELDHEVLVVGYGSDGPGLDYWIVKNSWSIYWGDRGFVKMARNRNNACGIASQANYALF